MRIRDVMTKNVITVSPDTLVVDAEKILKENRDKISGSDASTLDSALASAKKTLENSSAETSELNAAVEELTHASHKLAEAMYRKTSSEQAPPSSAEGGAGSQQGSAGSGKKEDEVIDAEYVDMDDKKS